MYRETSLTVRVILLHLINFLPHRGLSLSVSPPCLHFTDTRHPQSSPHHSPQPPVSAPRPLVPRLGSEEKWNFDEVSHVSSYCISSLHCHSVLFQHNLLISGLVL